MYPISHRPRAFVLAACGAGAALAVAAAAAVAHPALHTNRRCYVVGQTVHVSGSGFAPSTPYTVMLDGVYLGGNPMTNSQGDVAVRFGAGGLPAGYAQHIDHVTVDDGTGNVASTSFTLTRPALAHLALSRTSRGYTGRLSAWGFSRDGTARELYLHYVNPSGRNQQTLKLGTTHGACGTLVSKPELFVPFSLARGTWTLQVDTRRSYSSHPDGPVSRIRVGVS